MNKLEQEIKKINKNYFSLNDLRKISHLQEASLKVAINRLIKEKKIIRLANNFYTVEPAKIVLEKLAQELLSPSYISFETALAHYGIISQKPSNLTLATLGRSQQKKVLNVNLIFRHLQKNLFWGYVRLTDYYLATPEKALIDLIYLSLNGNYRIDLTELELNVINRKIFKQYLEKVENKRLKMKLRMFFND